jgi:hypothetical protein
MVPAHRDRVVALGAVVSLLAGVTAAARQQNAAPPPAPGRPERSLPFEPGEALTYNISWAMFSKAGTLTTTVRDEQTVSGAPAYEIVAEAGATGVVGRLYHLRYRADTLFNTATLAPWRGSIYTEEGRRRRTHITRFHPADATGEYEVRGSSDRIKTLDLPRGAQDALSALYCYRALPDFPRGRPGMTVTDGGDLFTVQVSVDGRELLETPLGTFDTWRITSRLIDEKGKPHGRTVVFWFSDDERRLPVRVRVDLPVGALTVTLESATLPAHP